MRRSTKQKTLAAAQRAADRMEAEAWMNRRGESPDKLKDEFLKWAMKPGIPESKALDWLDTRTTYESQEEILASLTRLEAKFDRIEKILRAAFDGVLDLRGLIGCSRGHLAFRGISTSGVNVLRVLALLAGRLDERSSPRSRD